MGAVYPWLGTEVIMVAVAVLAWLVWHVVQIREENQEYADDVKRYGSKEALEKALDEQTDY
ncbi:MAG: hypothetical protein ACR2J1_08450 [Methyloceanibacter sp.]|uniref:hypothetical protein n=1 Tax=Methyloceanibacter sp. TaxID=1965321 RepID=UPI003D9BF683